jgi:nucleosome binding factor SPN SPT16 subunit
VSERPTAWNELIRLGRHPYVLKNVFPRPAPEGKKSDGNLEIHTNGIRFRPDGPGSKIGES